MVPATWLCTLAARWRHWVLTRKTGSCHTHSSDPRPKALKVPNASMLPRQRRGPWVILDVILTAPHQDGPERMDKHSCLPPAGEEGDCSWLRDPSDGTGQAVCAGSTQKLLGEATARHRGLSRRQLHADVHAGAQVSACPAPAPPDSHVHLNV